MTAPIRQLTTADAGPLEAFLVQHRDSSMFLRANARRAGLAYDGQIFQAIYAAAFAGERIVGVAGHCWNGMLLLQAPDATETIARACVEMSRREVTGLAGPLAQVQRARDALGLADRHAALDGQERMYGLDLTTFSVPAALEDRVRRCRPPRREERDLLCAWRLAYDIETLGATDTEDERRRSAEFLDAQIAEGNAWVALDGGVPVSLSALNAALPDIVQLGGIYTPPELRGRGHAKVSVAATLAAARERGATRAVLFTGNPSAERTYTALGFQLIGDYSLVLL